MHKFGTIFTHNHIFIFLLSIFILLPVSSSVQAEPSEQHCFAVLDSLKPGQTSSTVLEYRCFATEAESLYAGSHGKIRVSPTASRTEIDQAIQRYNRSTGSIGVGSQLGLNSQLVVPTLHSNALLARDWVGNNYTNSSLDWYSCSTCGDCGEGYQYLMADVGQAWYGRISSAGVYDFNCRHFTHYNYTNYGQPLIECGANSPCPTMGVMDNATLSIKLYY